VVRLNLLHATAYVEAPVDARELEGTKINHKQKETLRLGLNKDGAVIDKGSDIHEFATPKYIITQYIYCLASIKDVLYPHLAGRSGRAV
jgi:hypothetical protein